MLQQKMSPLVFIIPFAVMSVVIGVAMFAAGSGTDLRSHASNDKEKQCVGLCTRLGGSTAACTNVCPKVLNGSMSCMEAAEAVGVKSKVFLTACNKISPLADRSCSQYCEKAGAAFDQGAGAVKGICNKVCGDVQSGKTCSQACTDNLPQKLGKYMTMCTNMCAKMPVPSSPTPTPAGGSTPTPTPDSGSTPTPTIVQVNCESKCVPPSGLSQEYANQYKKRCASICADINSGTKSCNQACGTIGNAVWQKRCMDVFACPKN